MNTVRPATPTDARAVPAALLIAAILLLALNLRGPLVAVSAVVDPIRADLGIDAATVGLFTSLPVLCFGLAAPLASALLARTGTGRGVLVALAVLLVGIVVRSLGGLPAAIAGTLLLGLAITTANIAVPVVIGRDLRGHASAILGAYTATLNVGSMLSLTLTVPIAAATGWRAALASWGVLVVVAAALWWHATRRPRIEPAAGTTAPAGAPASSWRQPAAWGLTAAFAGQSFAYYGVTAWLPQLLRDELGMPAAGAGAASSVFQIAALGGAFGVPVLLRYGRARTTVLVVCAAWVTLPLGLLLAPHLWALWCVLGGAAQGGGLTVIFSLVVRVARDEAENRRFSALVQGGGYTVAAAGPPVIGAVHAATGGWTAPLLVVVAAIALLATAATAVAVGQRASRAA
ncbi:CynX/NimT family MFS transporter [Pseudonocardia sp. MH-G8]|uniref:MFS transporter n=1 Tax=Pseudonocardia sp. MH-G8 TaxID=1854588 RepID=UPI000BA06CF0|nr:MFS transporter [Pseudonocardia sp. MH-G8]OZM81336.1 MFS transporter [Pseudonocardia sp. MH-G8]